MTDKQIADAARAYVQARKDMKGKSTDDTCRATDLAFDRLVAAVEECDHRWVHIVKTPEEGGSFRQCVKCHELIPDQWDF